MKKMMILSAVVFAVSLSFLLAPRALLAQKGNRLESEEKLNEYYDKHSVEGFNIMQGEQKQKNLEPAQKKVIELMAKYFVYYMTIPERQKDGNVFKRRDEYYSWLNDYILTERARNKNKEFRDLYAHELIKCFKAVFVRNSLGILENDIPSCVNAAMLLPGLGKLDNPEVVDFLTDLIRDPGKAPATFSTTLAGLTSGGFGQGAILSTSALAPTRSYGVHDAIKLYAFKGLQEYFKVSPPTLNQYANEKERKLVADRLNPLVDYLLNPPGHLESKTEVDGYRFIRCEAIKTLGMVPLPFVPEVPALQGANRYKGILSPVAYALFRVLADEESGLYPTPSLSEKAAAAIGVCNINATLKLEENLDPRFNEDMGVALVGSFLVQYVQAYIKDREIFASGKKLPPMIHWRVTTELLQKALADYPKNLTPGKKAVTNLAKITNAVSSTLDAIHQYKTALAPVELNSILQGMDAPSPEVYAKTTYQIKLRWPPQ